MPAPRSAVEMAQACSAEEEGEELLLRERARESDNEDVVPASSGASRSPLDAANLWARLTFAWLAPLLQLGQTRQLQQADVPPLPQGDDSQAVSRAFDEAWTRVGPSPYRLGLALLRMERGVLLRAALAKLAHDTALFASPAALRALLCHIAGTEPPEWARGWPPALLVLTMFITALVQSVCIAQYFHHGYRSGMHARAALVLACYRKSLRLSPAARARFTTGEVMTYVTTDAKRLQDAAPYLQMAWSGPYQIALSVAMLWSTLGPAFWDGIGVIFALIPLSGLLSSIMVRLESKLMTAKDARVSRTAEALQAMKLLKSCAWERGFAARIRAARELELRQLTLSVGFSMLFGVLWEAVPLVTAMATYLSVVAAGGTLTASSVFASLALFDVIRFPLLVMPEVITQSAASAVSLRRVQAFLEADELENDADGGVAGDEPGVEVRDATLGWGEAPVLQRVSLRVHPGQLVCLLGAVGTGKSTLVAGLLGELRPTQGRLTVRGRVAYVAQSPFIVSGTLRDNICFGADFEPARYAAVLHAAALGPDVAALPAGDATEIGEHGVNLSGGQQQRVALARAAYCDADVYLFDDPLSAVDAEVGRHIFSCLLGPAGLLKDKARLLVTHGAQYLPQAHHIFVLSEGRVVEQGTFADLLVLGPTAHTHTLMQLATAGESMEAVNAVPPDVAAQTAAKPVGAQEQSGDTTGALTQEETRQEGRVDGSVYRYYLAAAGWPQSIGVMLLFIGWTALLAISKLWLARWAAAGGRHSAYWAGGYGAIGAVAIVVLLARQILRTVSQVRGGRRMHEALLSGVLRARMSFFNRTPTGRVLNRFSGDAATVDERLHDDACDLLRQVCAVGATGLVIAGATPVVLLAFPLLGAAFSRVQRRYGASARELQRLESVARSPIFSCVSEALSGVTTIRAFRQAPRFQTAHAAALDANLAAYFAFQSTNRWLTVRTEALAACVVGLAAGAALQARARVDPGAAGLSITYAMAACASLSWLVRALSMVETEIVSVERMKEFAELTPEPPLVLHDSRPPKGWPSAGAIELRELSMRYRPDLPRVLCGITLSINGGEKIGVCGRTGAGKSSILLALLRLADPECTQGRIIIDRVDTALIGVADLRNGVGVIPQEGTLFAGSLRFNLDPLAAHTDAQLLGALELVGLSPQRSLEDDVSEEGGNWSAGQRQLLCLARAALKKSKVVLADEATSSCDAETDAMMQVAMRRAFAGATVLTVAHRMGTITDSDRVLVMSAGAVAEWGTPAALTELPGGMYRALLDESRRAAEETSQ